MIAFIFYVSAILLILTLAGALADLAGRLWPHWTPGLAPEDAEAAERSES
jgi:hypothetical protein